MKSFTLLGLILLIHTLILTKLFFFPYPELFIYPYLTNQGLKPYQQILDQHFPGLMFLPINLNNLGMTTPEVARVWLMAIVIITQVLLFAIARQIFKSDFKALLVNILYLIWQPFFEGWVLWIDSFLPLILLPAFYFLYKDRIFLTGLLLGIGIVFKQVLIPLSALVLIYMFWEMRGIRVIRKYLLGLSLPVALMIIYLLSIGVLKAFWYWTVIFNLTTFAQHGRKDVPTLAHLLRMIVVFGTGLVSLKFLSQKIVQFLLIFMFGALLSAYARFDFVHLQPALPFAILATVYGLGKLGGLGKIGVVWVGYILISVWWLSIFYKGHLGNKVLFFDPKTYQIASKIRQYTKPNEKIFIFGAVPHLYQISNTLPAGNIFVFQFPWFLKVAQDRVLQGIINDKPEIVVSDRTVTIEGQKMTDFADKIDQYILGNYQPFDQVGSSTILRRKAP